MRAKRQIARMELSVLSNGLNTTCGHSIRRTRYRQIITSGALLSVRGIIGAVQLTAQAHKLVSTENFIYSVEELRNDRLPNEPKFIPADGRAKQRLSSAGARALQTCLA